MEDSIFVMLMLNLRLKFKLMSSNFEKMAEFIDRFLTNIFIDDDFCALQISLILIKLLLQYHDPELSNFLLRADVTTEMYAIPWFITYMANKIPDINILLEFWEMIVYRNQPSFIFAFLTSFLLFNRATIMASDVPNLPVVMTSLKI